MTKIGTGESTPQPSKKDSHLKLNDHIMHFQIALTGYQIASTWEEKNRQQSIMRQQMEQIHSNVLEIKRLGIQKQNETVRSNFERFNKDPTRENIAALEQEMATLREFGFDP